MDVEKRAASWRLDGLLVAVAGDEIVGFVHVDASCARLRRDRHGGRTQWRGRGVGSALMTAAIEWARAEGLHKLSLSVFAHNAAAIALYRKCGFVEEGRRVQAVPARERRALGCDRHGALALRHTVRVPTNYERAFAERPEVWRRGCS